MGRQTAKAAMKRPFMRSSSMPMTSLPKMEENPRSEAMPAA